MPDAASALLAQGRRAGRAIAALSGTALVALAMPAQAEAGPCERQRLAGADFVVCTVDPARADLRLFWQDDAGTAYRRFSALADDVARGGQSLVFAMNAGMYAKDFSPIGLYVQAGRQLQPLNTRVVNGTPAQVPNFYKQPNGVFFLDDAGAGVLTSEAYAQRRPRARFATQSGPMLVIDGKLHPAFIEGSTDRTRRNGVGVCDDGQVRFVISDAGINFHDFARVFRDELRCPNALFLDGGRGAGLYAPDLQRDDRSWHGGYGPMVGVVAAP